MVCTAITMIDPIMARVIFWINPEVAVPVQLLTFGLTDLVLIALILIERNSKSGREVFPAMLGVFVLLQIPALLGLPFTEGWQGFAQWYGSLPLS